MRTSDELMLDAAANIRAVTGCTGVQAEAIVHSIAAYTTLRDQVDKDKLRKLKDLYGQCWDNFGNDQKPEHVWPLLVTMGATLDAVLQELTK